MNLERQVFWLYATCMVIVGIIALISLILHWYHSPKKDMWKNEWTWIFWKDGMGPKEYIFRTMFDIMISMFIPFVSMILVGFPKWYFMGVLVLVPLNTVPFLLSIHYRSKWKNKMQDTESAYYKKCRASFIAGRIMLMVVALLVFQISVQKFVNSLF